MTDTPSIEELVRRFVFEPVPQHRALGMELLRCLPGDVDVLLPYSPKLVGNPETGVLHGGVITTLLDSTCGCAAFSALRSRRRVATLDLRIDYLRAARPGQAVVAHAECYRVTKHVAFVRGSAHDGDPADVVATAAATFAIFEPKPKRETAR